MDKIHNYLIEIGVPVSNKGFDYLHDAISLVMNDSKWKGNTCKLYTEVAKGYDTNGYAVERCIRHSIETVFDKGDKKKLTEILGEYKVEEGHITNSEFIAISALRLK